MNRQINITLIGILLLASLAGLAREQQLAGILLGETQKSVITKLGKATGRIYAVPPSVEGGSSTDIMSVESGNKQKMPNTLYFTNFVDMEIPLVTAKIVRSATPTSVPYNNNSGTSTPITPSVTTPGTTTPTTETSATDNEFQRMMKAQQDEMERRSLAMQELFAGRTGGSRPTSSPATVYNPASSSSAGSGNTVQLPAWAYGVRVNDLEINQEQLIFRINDYYTIGVTFDGKGGNGQVIDVAICSYEPLKPNLGYDKKTDQPILNLTQNKTKKIFAAKTTSGIHLASSLAEILKNQGWTTDIYPFAAVQVSEITVQDKVTSARAVSVAQTNFVRNPNSDTVTPTPSLYQSDTTVVGLYPITFTTENKEVENTFKVGFTDSYYINYPDSGVAYTMVKNKVVRIQIGQGVHAPYEIDALTGGTNGTTPGSDVNGANTPTTPVTNTDNGIFF